MAKAQSESTPLIANGDTSKADIETGPSFASPPPPTPTWSEAFAFVSPFLKPRDRHHTVLACLSLLTVLLEKVCCHL